jgi:hypothetical protein
MKWISSIAGILLFIAFTVMPVISQAQTADKNAAAIKKLELNMETAKKNVAKNEKTMAVSDSLIQKGNEMVAESKIELKALASERKKLDKEYATNRKALEKQSFSKDKAEAAKAKTDLKALDTKYKTDSKELDNKQKLADKNSLTGASNINKGKTSQKAAQDGLKTARESLEAAEIKLNNATNPSEEGSTEKKKKK